MRASGMQGHGMQAGRMRGNSDLLRYGPVVALVAVSAAMLVATPSVLRIAFLGLVAVTAVAVFRQSRTLYIQLCLWLWFLTPWLRRMIDWRTSYTEQSLMLSAPYVAAAISGVVLLRHGRSLARPGGVPFACALAGILFGTLYGLTRFSLFEVARGLVNWLAPVLFGFFLYEERRRYAEYRDAFVKSLVWGTLVMSLYGLVQFFVLPDWDVTWMKGLVYTTFGSAEPREVRVFSTMNAPAVLAFYLTAGMLVCLTLLVDGNTKRKWLPAVTAPLALICLGLTLSRSLWLALVVSLIYLAATMPGRLRFRIVGISLVALAIAAAGSQAPGIRDILAERLKTFTSGTQDVSASARIQGHEDALGNLAVEPMGEGMGSTDVDHATDGSDDSLGPHDSTLLEFLYSLGGPGTLIYAIGMGYAGTRIYLARGPKPAAVGEPFGFAMRATLVGLFAQCLLTSIAVGPEGFVTWTCLAFALAGSEPVLRAATAEAHGLKAGDGELAARA